MLQKLSLFSTKKEVFLFTLLSLFIFSYSLLIEYNNYKNFTAFDTQILEVSMIKQYEKTKLTKKGKTQKYQVLKLQSSKGFSFYTSTHQPLQPSVAKDITLKIWTNKITFYEYMTSFYSFSKIISIGKPTLKNSLNTHIDKQHVNSNIGRIYQALYTARQLPKELQSSFSALGVSHLLAISGFHLGVLSALLFFLFKTPYKLLQNRYFPYRSYKLDSFIFIAIILLIYVLFLDTPPSLLRAFVMLLIGFVLYDRGYKIISMQTLLLTITLILAFSPRYFFAVGFWLSVSGVFYIFLFLIHFKHLSKTWQFMLVPVWVYIMMLPVSFYLFETFSLYHPLSVLWTFLFTFFYPLSIFLHFTPYANLFDGLLLWMLELDYQAQKIVFTWYYMLAFTTLSLLSIYKKSFTYLLLAVAIFTFIYSIYNVT